MSKFTKEMIDDYAHKLLIGLTKEEREMVASEFDYIDETIDVVTKISNIEKVEPMTHALDDFEVELRSDVAKDSILVEDLLSNADMTDGREIEVVKVVG